MRVWSYALTSTSRNIVWLEVDVLDWSTIVIAIQTNLSLTAEIVSANLFSMTRITRRFCVTLLVVTLLSVGLTACPMVDPPAAFGLPGILSFCSETANDFRVFCKAIVKSEVQTEISVNSNTNYSMLFPSNTAIATYIVQHNLTENDFLSSPDLIVFVKKHVVLGVLTPGISLPNLAGTSVSISGSAPSMMLNSSIIVGIFPYAVKTGNNIWLYGLNKIIQ